MAMIFPAAMALLMTGLYARTKRPKLYAAVNSLAGIAAILLIPLAMTGTLPEVSYPEAAVSAVLGVPGAALCLLLPILFHGG